MRVACVTNEVSAIKGREAQERVLRSINIDGPISDLVVGQEYIVRAVEVRDGGLWVYLHTVPVNHYPYPYPIELFEVRSRTLPASWVIGLTGGAEGVHLRRLAIPAWANDDCFYERLVDGEEEIIRLYQSDLPSD